MPNHALPAQRLPSDVVRLIIQYSASRDMETIHECLSVSSTWRQTALEYMWRELCISIAEEKRKINSSYPSWFDYYWLPHKTEHLVKELRISVPWLRLFDGTAYDLLLDYMGETSTLPHVRKLRIEIINEMGNPSFVNGSAISNSLKFAQLVRSLTPALITVNLKHGEVIFPLDEFVERVLEDFLKTMFADTQNAMLDISGINFRSTSIIECIPQLTSLKVCCGKISEVGTGLVYKCADTLVQLEVWTNSPKELLYDIKGNGITYPNLKALTLVTKHRVKLADKQMAENIVPFPSLKLLSMPNRYPFGDDVMFRGNSATLRHLDIGIDGESVEMLNKYRVFEIRHRSLCIVRLREANTNSDLSDVPETETNYLLGNLLQNTQMLSIHSELLVSRLIASAQAGHGFENIQKLDAHVRLSLVDTLNLVKALPALLELSCGINSLGPELDHISAEELPDYISSTYMNTGKSLRDWNAMLYNRKRYRETAKYIALLALACPNFYRVRLRQGFVYNFKTGIVEVLESKAFSKYSSVLHRLLDGVYWLKSTLDL